ncbi:MAG: hypothetical protein OXC62_12955 [Aestuariivita sp.]|nr:hypothetical protein [Aestuariivita sp.]
MQDITVGFGSGSDGVKKQRAVKATDSEWDIIRACKAVQMSTIGYAVQRAASPEIVPNPRYFCI